MKVSPGTIKTCVNILNEGNLMAISPGTSILDVCCKQLLIQNHFLGGVYEAQFGNNYYELLWQNRMGFAKVAIESKAPIIPMFTENIREGFRSISIAKRIFVKLYNFSRFPVRPIFGGFPVKFRTHLGKPILYEPGITPEQLVQKVANAIEDLIVQNQRIPGSIFHALLDRFRDQSSLNIGSNKKKQRKYSCKEQ